MKKQKRKIKIGIIFGGKSSEHEVSLQSAKSVYEALDKNKYEPVLIGIDKKGQWRLHDHAAYLLHADNPKLIKLNKSNRDLALATGQSENKLLVATGERGPAVDVVFPVLHGSNGEDGTMQGLLQLMNIPYVGPDVLGSAVGMDKDVAKRLLEQAGIPVAKFLVARNPRGLTFKKLRKQLGAPFFVKPANSGSSVGVHKVHTKKELATALADAFSYDHKILIEEAIVGREIEVSVLGNEEPRASVPGEVKPAHEFYSYVAKYIDEHGAELVIPAALSKKQVRLIQELAIRTFQTLCLEGMARVDLFLTKNEKVYINEVNTIPGFTKISMYPKLWEASGIPYPKLLDLLIELAIKRHRRNANHSTNFSV